MARERLKSPRARLFVALDLPEGLRRAIEKWQRAELTDPALRPVRPESLHLTLVFLGYHPEKQIGRIAEAALSVEASAPSILLAREPVSIPPRGRTRLLAFDAASEGVVALKSAVERRLVEARLHRPEGRPFWPHLTVARVRPERRGGRKPARVERRPGPLTEHAFLRPIPLVRLVLFRSHQRREGSVYEPVAELELPRD